MAKKSSNTYKISAAKEKLELGKINLVPDRYTLQEYLNKISENNTIDSNKIVEIDDFTVDVIVDGYVFRVTEDEDNDGKKDGHITYRYISELKNIQPEVVIKSLITTTGTIKVEVKPRYAQNEEYEYYIKDGEAGENTYQKDGDKTTSTEHTFTGVTENKIYTIKVVLKMKGKNDATVEQNAKTVEMKTLSEAEMVFTDNPSSWTNTDVEVTVSVTNEEVQEQIQNGNYRIQTKLNDGSFEYSDSQTATAQNDTIGATVTDGYGNYTGAATHKVKYIDKQKPNATAPTLVDKTTSTIKVEYKQEDIAPEGEEASGIVTRKYRLTNAEGTEGEWKDSGIFEGLTHGQTYYVQTYAKDEAGNEQNSNVLTVELENVIDATGGSASPTSLTSSDVTVTLQTISGYTTRYTTNGDNPTLSSTEYTGPFTVPSNCTVKYVYTDGTNIGGAGIVTVSNIDKNTYTISYNMNGLSGVTHSNPKTSYKVDDNNFNLVNPSKSGYTFIGWTGGNYLGLDQYTTSNPYVCKGRDHFPGNEISVTPGTTYRVYVTAKRTRGSIALRGGIWYTQRTSGNAYDGYGEYTLEKDLGDNWGRYYRDVTVPEGKSKGKIFLQIDQSATAGWSTDWSVANMEIATTTLTVPKGSQGNKTYTAHWSYTVEINGSGLDQSTKTHNVMIAGAQANKSDGRGLTTVKFNRMTGAVTQTASYDTYGNDASRTNVANVINNSTNDELIAIFSQDATAYNSTLKTALTNVGIDSGRIWYAPTNSNANSGSRIPTAIFVSKGFKGQSGIVESFTGSAAPKAYIKINVRDGVPTRQSYSISYNLNSGSLPSGYKSWYLPTDNNFNLTNPTRDNYSFSGWTGSNGSTKQITVAINKGSTGDRTYTANWTINSYTVTLDRQSGSGGSASVTATYNSAMPSATMPTRTGYTFGGYYTEKEGKGTQYYNANGGSARNWDKTSATTLYAKWIQNVTNFEYSGSVESYVAPVTGTYKLEVWGAQGGNTPKGTGGKGGYSYGSISLTQGQTIYVCVGSQPSSTTRYNLSSVAGGYNGGGNGGSNNDTYWGAGGGATHIAKSNNRGVLSNYANYKSEILIVAGGGGGSGQWNGTGTSGGTGGGTSGGNSSHAPVYGVYGEGGTQSKGGSSNGSKCGNGTFGKGGKPSPNGSGGRRRPLPVVEDHTTTVQQVEAALDT